MKMYCFVCKIDTENKDAKVMKTKKSRLVLLSKCSVCGNKKTIFISEKEGSGILSSRGIKTPLSKIPGLNIIF